VFVDQLAQMDYKVRLVLLAFPALVLLALLVLEQMDCSLLARKASSGL
jgi:hypothetical protein